MRLSVPADGLIQINVIGSTMNIITVRHTDAVGSLFEIIGQPDGRVVFNGSVLCPALSFAFYGIGNMDSIYLVGSRKETLRRNKSDHGLLQAKRELENTREMQVKRYFDEHYAERVQDPEMVLQRFQHAVSPVTSTEHARLTDVYRCRIETNCRAFRKLCSKFRTLEKMEQRCSSNVQVTVVPERAKVPSTDYLPLFGDLSVASESISDL